MYLKKHEIIFKSMEKLADAVENARSIGAYNEPVEPKYIGSLETEYNVYHFYQDSDGRFYFSDERCLQFDKIIEEHRKGRKKSWNRWI